MPIEITADTIKSNCNLTELKKPEVISTKILLIDELVKSITTAESYESVVLKTADSLTMSLFSIGFSYLMYAEILEFLNTNTSGNGIVKSTGFDNSRIDLLSQSEIDKKRNSLELKAYQTLKKYLNETGKTKLEKLIFWSELERVDVDNIEAKASILKKNLSPRKPRMALI